MMVTRPRRIRFDELHLALLTSLLALTGAWLVAIHDARTPVLSWPDLKVSSVFAAVILAVPLVWSIVDFRGDQIVFPVVATLSVVGYVTLLRLSPDLGDGGRGSAQLDVRQLIYVCGGMVIMLLVGRFFRHWHLLRRYQYTLLIVCIGLLLATFVFGTTINGARLWISVGPIQIQPSEVIKIGLVLFLAAYLDERREVMGSNWRLGPFNLPPVPYLLPMLLMWGTSLAVLVVENDLGSALLLFGIFLVMVYVGTGRSIYVLAAMVTFAIACWISLALFDRIGIRVQNWLDPWRDPLDTGYQQIQSDYAIANGGALGVGIGNGQPSLIPAVETDFIFSALAEENGLLGTLAVLTLYAVLVFRGFTIGLRQASGYLRMVAIGLSASLGIQAAVILGGVLRLIPLTGITLPFVSYGGSSMLTNFLMIGLLANISASPADLSRRRAQS